MIVVAACAGCGGGGQSGHGVRDADAAKAARLQRDTAAYNAFVQDFRVFNEAMVDWARPLQARDLKLFRRTAPDWISRIRLAVLHLQRDVASFHDRPVRAAISRLVQITDRESEAVVLITRRVLEHRDPKAASERYNRLHDARGAAARELETIARREYNLR